MSDIQTTAPAKLTWTPSGLGNIFCRLNDQVMVSYNPNTSASPMTPVMDTFLLRISGDDAPSLEETALEYRDKWFILDGDFRQKIETAYAKHGIQGILNVFKSHGCDHPFATGKKNDLRLDIES